MVDQRHGSLVQKVQVQKWLTRAHNHTVIREYVAVELRDHLPHDDIVSEAMVLKVIEKIEKFLVVTVQQAEDQLVFERWRKVVVKVTVLVLVDRLDNPVQVAGLDIVSDLVIDVRV